MARRGKLTTREVLEIYNATEGNYEEIGRRFGVTGTTVSMIRRGKHCQEITGGVPVPPNVKPKSPTFAERLRERNAAILLETGSHEEVARKYWLSRGTVYKIRAEARKEG